MKENENVRRYLQEFGGGFWSIAPGWEDFAIRTLSAGRHGRRRRAQDDEEEDDPLGIDEEGKQRQAQNSQNGRVARTGFAGIMTRRFSGPGILNTEAMVEELSRLFSSKAEIIIAEINSPGGEVLGTQTAADAIAKLRADNPSKALIWTVGTVAASAAYWIASQGHMILTEKDAVVGSIGVIAAVADWSRLLKNAGIDLFVFRSGELKAPGIGTFTERMKAFVVAEVQKNFSRFVNAVETGRLVKLADEVLDGRTFRGDEAIDFGLVDRAGDIQGNLEAIVEGLLSKPE